MSHTKCTYSNTFSKNVPGFTVIEKKTEKKLNFRNFLLMFEIQKSNILFNYSPRYSPVKPWQSAANNTITKIVQMSSRIVKRSLPSTAKCKTLPPRSGNINMYSE